MLEENLESETQTIYVELEQVNTGMDLLSTDLEFHCDGVDASLHWQSKEIVHVTEQCEDITSGVQRLVPHTCARVGFTGKAELGFMKTKRKAELRKALLRKAFQEMLS